MDAPVPATRSSPFRTVAAQAQSDVDLSHVQRLVARVTIANQNGMRAREETRRTRRELARVEEGLRHQLGIVRGELVALHAESETAVKRLEGLVGQFRALSRAGEFARLRDRTDAWSPESRITREQFQKLLDTSFSSR